ncbi:MAG: hypothetical protein MJK10_01335 [Pseudomonadales bacterium]|nr:hypothetical protein [Pseudomonadales bacterium]NRA14519.1 hypothetical protein [Oceanospirillaceae bacterium]
MKPALINRVEIDKIKVIDWYDGVVTGLITITDRTGWFFASLLAWNPESQEKIFSIFPLNMECSDRLIEILSDDSDSGVWSSLEHEIITIRTNYLGNVMVIKCLDLGEPVISGFEDDLDVLQIRSQVGRDIEDVILDDRSTAWFDSILDVVSNH